MERSRLACTNCGRTGQGYKTCYEPITSIGILALQPGASAILMIQRKDSIGYIDFLRGKYNLGQPEYIAQLLNGMSLCELQKLRSNVPFEQLWTELWNGAARDSTEATEKYTAFCANNDLHKLLKTATGWPTPEWGFPKGRRVPGESELVCAMREFEEETGLSSSQYTLTSTEPIEDVFEGTDGKLYRHRYYTAKSTATVDVSTAQQREIGDIQWVPLEMVAERLRGRATVVKKLRERLGL